MFNGFYFGITMRTACVMLHLGHTERFRIEELHLPKYSILSSDTWVFNFGARGTSFQARFSKMNLKV